MDIRSIKSQNTTKRKTSKLPNNAHKQTQTFYTYFLNDPATKRINRPEIWKKTDQANGEMYGSYPVFSHIPGSREDEPIRYGNLVFDIDTGSQACNDAQKIICYFETVFGIEPDQWLTYLSGKKGCHLELAPETMGIKMGHRLLPQIYKRLALDVKAATDVAIDFSMYCMGTGKPYRRPNIKRTDNGKYKVQVDLDELAAAAADYQEYLALVTEQRMTWIPSNISRCDPLAKKIEFYSKEAEKSYEQQSNALPISEEECVFLRKNEPPCISFMKSAVIGKATFNEVAMAIIAYYVTAKIPESEFLNSCAKFIEYYPSSSLNSEGKRYKNAINRYRSMLAHGYTFECATVKALGFHGNTFNCQKCHYNQTKRDEYLKKNTEISLKKLFEEFEVKSEYVDKLGDEHFLYPNLVIANHVVTIIAMSGGGKTTFFFFHVAPLLVREKKQEVWYLDADSPPSDHKKMKEFADNHGFSFLNPDANQGTSIESLLNVIKTISYNGRDLTDHVFIVDTLKKFADLMRKNAVKEFYKLTRKLTTLGATVILLGHSNKYPDKSGNLVFEGTGDVRSDSDELIYFHSKKNQDGDGIDVTTIVDPTKNAKVRGIFDPLSFNISTTRTIRLYDSPLPVLNNNEKPSEQKVTEEEILETAASYLAKTGQPMLQKILVDHVSKMTNAGINRVRNLIIENSSNMASKENQGKRFVYRRIKNNACVYELPNSGFIKNE